jgi:hypothetical protein
MIVHELKNVERKEMLISYRRVYTVDAVMSLTGNGSETMSRIEFAVEDTALGIPEITVSILDNVEYPLIPVIRILKEHIIDLEKTGQLPRQ